MILGPMQKTGTRETPFGVFYNTVSFSHMIPPPRGGAMRRRRYPNYHAPTALIFRFVALAEQHLHRQLTWLHSRRWRT